jgi:hypothetical protein
LEGKFDQKPGQVRNGASWGLVTSLLPTLIAHAAILTSPSVQMLTTPKPQQWKQTVRGLVFPQEGEERNHLHVFVCRIEMSHSPRWPTDDSELSGYISVVVILEQDFQKGLDTNPKKAPFLGRAHCCFLDPWHLLLLVTLVTKNLLFHN